MKNFLADGYEYAVRAERVYRRPQGATTYLPCTRRALLEHAVDSALWDWLRMRGIRRPSPPSSTYKESDRRTTQVKLRLRPEVAQQLHALAERRGATVSDTVTFLVLEQRS